MRVVLLSGGSGKRLWPLSNEIRSKQFLPLLPNPAGEMESMVQRVWRQLIASGLHKGCYITTSRFQLELLQNQLGGEVSIIVEPERWDTFAAIALAATYLYSTEGVSLDEVITVMPVDSYVDETFFARVRSLENTINDSDAELGLIGVVPRNPSENLGYIVPDAINCPDDKDCLKVQSFKEKPCRDEAEALINQGALWNCGVFAFRLDLIINLLISMNQPIQYEEMSKKYRNLQKTSFDYAVVEKLRHIVVVPHKGEWRDLGTWSTLTEAMDRTVHGKGFLTEDCQSSHIINELEIPITIVGLSNIVVAASPDGILVSEKSASSGIKDLCAHMNQRPMYEERRWGFYKVIDFLQYPDGREVLTKRIMVTAGKNLSYQYHHNRSEVWTVISGKGEMILDEAYQKIEAGDVIRIPSGSKHSLRALTDLEIIEVQHGGKLVEDDIVRLYMNWEEIMNLVYVY